MARKKKIDINPRCIFCGTNKGTQPYFFPPLEHTFRPVCNNCLPIMDMFIRKYPHLWET